MLAVGGAYRLWPSAGDGCAYCGVVGDTYDHVPPVSQVYALGLEHFDRNGIRLWRVPCCRECNGLLGDLPGDSVSDRRKVLKARLRHKYGRLLRMPAWTPEQLSELGYNLRSLVEAGVDVREWVKRRLQW